MDLLPSESERPGFHFEGDVIDLAETGPFERGFTFMPCEMQTRSQGYAMAAVKVLDGRLYWGCLLWLRAWCLRCNCMYAEQPDVFLVDIYDAPYVVTDSTEWGGTWQKMTLI